MVFKSFKRACSSKEKGSLRYFVVGFFEINELNLGVSLSQLCQIRIHKIKALNPDVNLYLFLLLPLLEE